MKLEVSRCYILTSDGKEKKFRVIKRDSRGVLIIRYCETGIEEDFYTKTSIGGFSEDFTIIEFNCEDCDGNP